MKRLLPILLVFGVFLGSAGESTSADFQKGLAAARSGDFATALREWTPLAKQGLAPAQNNLGNAYGRGQGVIQDNVYAHMWLNIAASSGGSENASGNRDIIAKRMSVNAGVKIHQWPE